MFMSGLNVGAELAVMVNPLKSRTTGPVRAVEMLIADTPAAELVKFPVRTYVPGAVMSKGNTEIWVLAGRAACSSAVCAGACINAARQINNANGVVFIPQNCVSSARSATRLLAENHRLLL